MYQVLVSDKLSEAGLKILAQTPGLQVTVKTGLSEEELVKTIPDYDALIIRSGTTVTAHVIEAAGKLKVIGRAGIGVDNVDLKAATAKGIIVMNTPTGNAVTTAEHALALMFAVSRKIPQAVRSLKSGEWDRKRFTGRQLCGKTLGIIGVGNIGKIVADRALGLKMKVLGFDPFLSSEAAAGLGIEAVTLEQLAAKSDYITIHTPLNDKTRGLVNRALFQKMKPGVIVINCARGGIVVEKDLNWALEQGIVAGAALDVYETEPPAKSDALIQNERVVTTPHLGAATDEAQESVALEIAELVAAYLSTGVIQNAVNVPSVSAETLKVLAPYLSLAEKLGAFQGQLIESLPKTIHIEYRGEVIRYEVAPLTTSLLKGLLVPMLEGVNVNYVNAPVIAKERGIKVIESKVKADLDFASLIKVAVEGSAGVRTLSGTIFGRSHPRLVQIDHFYLEAIPEGILLYIHNEDRPGVIGRVGSFLGEHGVNISRMQLGLEADKAEAVALYSVDQKLSLQLLRGLAALPHILSVKQVEL